MAFWKSYRKYLITSGLIWAVCLVVLILVYVIVLAPQNQTRKRLESGLAETKQTYEFAQKAAKKETKVQLYQQIEDLRNKLDFFVIDFEDSANLSFDISQIAGEKKVTSLTVENKRSKPTGPTVSDPNTIVESQISVSFIADFQQFATFLNALERNKPILFVREFTLTPASQGHTGYQVRLDVTALVKNQQFSRENQETSEHVVGFESGGGRRSEIVSWHDTNGIAYDSRLY